MATNETLISVPATVEDPLALRKFLLRLVEKLDIVLGYRGQDPYITKNDLETPENFLSTLPTQINDITKAISNVSNSVTDLQNEQEELLSNFNASQLALYKTKQLTAAYYDFNYVGYGTLGGLYEFTTLGSNLVNPPFLTNPVMTYTCFFYQYLGLSGGVVQTMFVVSSVPDRASFRRVGTTFAQAITLGWF